MTHQEHQSEPKVLNRRSLIRDHRRLAGLLRPGMTVLDVGCGTGAITVGIAHAVGPTGHVIGVDRDSGLLEIAKKQHSKIPNLSFEQKDALSLPFQNRFDVVTAARTLQWIAQAGEAIRAMKAAIRPGGQLVVLDYNHANNSWEPDPPPVFTRFYQAFLGWRAANHWDNRMAEHLPELFRAAGIPSVKISEEDEIVERGDPGFPPAVEIWTEVIRGVGPRMVAAEFLTEPDRVDAEEAYRDWTGHGLRRQILELRTVIGNVA